MLTKLGKKSIRVMLAVLITVTSLLFSSCAGEDNWIPVGMKLASTEAVDYRMFVPESWTIDISTGVITAYVSNTDRSNITMMAYNLENENAAMTLEEYWTKHEGDLLATFPDMKYAAAASETSSGAEDESGTVSEENAKNIATPVSMLLDGIPAHKYTYDATVTGMSYRFMQTVAIRAGIVYIFTYTSTPAVFDSHLEDITSIFDNFQFQK